MSDNDFLRGHTFTGNDLQEVCGRSQVGGSNPALVGVGGFVAPNQLAGNAIQMYFSQTVGFYHHIILGRVGINAALDSGVSVDSRRKDVQREVGRVGTVVSVGDDDVVSSCVFGTYLNGGRRVAGVPKVAFALAGSQCGHIADGQRVGTVDVGFWCLKQDESEGDDAVATAGSGESLRVITRFIVSYIVPSEAVTSGSFNLLDYGMVDDESEGDDAVATIGRGERLRVFA